MKSNPAVPGGSLTSKPTWSNTLRVFHHVGFFCFRSREKDRVAVKSIGNEIDHPALQEEVRV